MNRSKLEQALRHIYDAREKEILCSEFFDQLSEYVDLEIAGKPAAERMPEVKYHLEHCRVCGEEYETLREFVRLDEQGGAPSVDELKKSL